MAGARCVQRAEVRARDQNVSVRVRSTGAVTKNSYTRPASTTKKRRTDVDTIFGRPTAVAGGKVRDPSVIHVRRAVNGGTNRSRPLSRDEPDANT